MKTKEILVDDQFPGGMRIDKYLSLDLVEMSRSQLKQCMQTLTVNGKAVKPGRKVFPGDQIALEYTELQVIPGLKPENIPFVILYEDEDVMVINKPQGMIVHPGSGNYTGTVVNGLLAHCLDLEKNFSTSGLRPGIVHRLDKDTSGVLITAKNVRAHEFLSEQFRNTQVMKTYLAVIKGSLPKQEDIIDIPVKRDPRHRKKFTTALTGGRRAITHYQIIKTFTGYSLVRLKPKTGRTHQLRVHLKHLRAPVLGDPIYSRQDTHYPNAGLMLHALELGIVLPNGQKQKFTAQLPDSFTTFFESMGWTTYKNTVL